MKILSLAKVEKKEVQMDGATGVTKQMPLSSRDGVPVHSWRVFTVAPGGHTPYHRHAFEHMNYVISGEGALVNEQGEELPVHAGDFALVLPNEKHHYKNTHPSEPLVFICGVPKEYE